MDTRLKVFAADDVSSSDFDVQSGFADLRTLIMKYFPVFALSVVGVVAAATAVLAQGTPRFWSVLRAEQTAGKQVFDNHCAVCHTQKHGSLVFGPSLRDVANRPAGSVAGFPYSNALKKSGLVWSEDNLRKWIAAISNPAEQVYLLAYLMQLKSPVAP
jgi:cytochrome c